MSAVAQKLERTTQNRGMPQLVLVWSVCMLAIGLISDNFTLFFMVIGVAWLSFLIYFFAKKNWAEGLYMFPVCSSCLIIMIELLVATADLTAYTAVVGALGSWFGLVVWCLALFYLFDVVSIRQASDTTQ